MSDKRRDELALLLYRRFGTGHPANSDLWRWHADAVLSLLAKHAVEED